MELIKISLPYFGRKSVQRLIFFKDTVQTVLNNGALRPKIDSGSCGAVGFHLLLFFTWGPPHRKAVLQVREIGENQVGRPTAPHDPFVDFGLHRTVGPHRLDSILEQNQARQAFPRNSTWAVFPCFSHNLVG